MPTCDAAALMWSPRTSVTNKTGVARCALVLGHEGEHQSLGVDEDETWWPTTVYWEELDRRTFRGELILCPDPRCVCPAGHRGNHAY